MDSTKFLSFWGWNSLPWNEPLQLDKLYWQESLQVTSTRVLLALQRTASLTVLTAPPGHGKSTLARWLYQKIKPEQHHVALFSLLHTEQQSGWLIPKLGHYLGLAPKDRSPRSVLTRLQESNLHKKILTIIIDDAHRLREAEALDEILSLIQVQAIASQPLNFILIGNPRLAQLIHNTEGCQHRLAFMAEIPALNRSEIAAFVTWRFEQFGLPPKILSPDAATALMNMAPVSFANLESILQGALLEAFVREQRFISPETLLGAMQAVGYGRQIDEPLAERDRLQSRTAAPQRKQKPGAPTGKSASQQALDLNSLYYKSGGGHDPEDV